MKPTPLQPIQWNSADETCCEPNIWRHLTFADDIIFAQFLADAADLGPEEVTNPELEPPQSEWVTVQPFVQNLFTSGLALTNGAEVEQTITLTTGNWYAVTVSIEYPFQGVQADPSTLIVSGFNEPMVFNAENGTQTMYGIWSGVSEVSFRRNDLSQFASPSPQMRVFQFSIKEVFAPTVEKITTGGSSTDDITLDIDYPYVNIEVNTSAIAADGAKCFQIKVTDNASNEYLSNFFHFVTESNCLIRLAGCGNNNFFQAGFTPNLRIEATIVDDGPIYDRNIYRNSLGLHRLDYGYSHQAYLLMIERCPEYIRRYLYLLPMFETIAVQVGQQDPKAYFAIEEVEKDPFAEGDQSLASLRCRLVPKQQNIESIFAGSCNVVLPPLVLGERSTDTVIGDTSTTPETAISAQ
jgi:hypothetical protein